MTTTEQNYFINQHISKNKIKSTLKLKEALIAVILFFTFATITSFDAKAEKQTAQQQLIAEQLKATFNKTTLSNLGPSPIQGLWQAEISNQVVYFSPTQELMIFGEIYTKNGVSLSEQTRQEWQTKKIFKVNFDDAITVGDGLIEIVEFTDTDCPFCQRFNAWVDKKNNVYQQKTGNDLFTRKVILTPIDQLHPNAHKEAVHILCQNPKDYRESITKTLNGQVAFKDMQDCKKGRDLLSKHRLIAQQFNVAATPTLIIDGQIIQGFNQQKLQQIIDKILKQLENNKE